MTKQPKVEIHDPRAGEGQVLVPSVIRVNDRQIHGCGGFEVVATPNDALTVRVHMDCNMVRVSPDLNVHIDGVNVGLVERPGDAGFAPNMDGVIVVGLLPSELHIGSGA